MPNNCEINAQICDVNCNPLSDDMSIGTPKLEIQCVTNALAQVGVVVFERGIASGHLVKRSTMR